MFRHCDENTDDEPPMGIHPIQGRHFDSTAVRALSTPSSTQPETLMFGQLVHHQVEGILNEVVHQQVR